MEQEPPEEHQLPLPIPPCRAGPRPPRHRAPAPPLRELLVDPDEHAGDIARFEAKIAYPPALLANGRPNPMCWIWTGAITDSYGQFSIVRNGHSYTVKAHRFAAAWKLGIPIPRGERADHTGGHRNVVEHEFCDNPLCVKADADRRIGHIWPSTQRDNLAHGGRRKRVGGSNWFVRRWSRLDKHERDERSRQLRAAVVDGWDDARVREVLLRIDPAQLDVFAHTR